MQTRQASKRLAAALELLELPKIKRQSKRAKKTAAEPVYGGWDVLPHNLGTVAAAQVDKQLDLPEQTEKKPIAVKDEAVEDEAVKDEAAKQVTAKLKRIPKKTKDNPYGLTPGRTPFPDWLGPSVEECKEVHDILTTAHGECKQPKTIPTPSLVVAGCGEVPSVLEAVMRTLMSGATSTTNANMAFQDLVKQYPKAAETTGTDTVDWNKVRLASLEDVISAIKRGGLATTKGTKMKQILDLVYVQNQAGDSVYKEEKTTSADATITGGDPAQGVQDLEVLKTEQIALSLDYIHTMEPDEAMTALTKLPGIGVKTASCVILFCLQKPSFAVDTHVWRLCKWLKWIPGNASRDDAFSHCEVRVPQDLKYGLHQLMIRHGKVCGRCAANTSEGTEDWDKAVCSLEHLLERKGKRKSTAQPRKVTKKILEEETIDEDTVDPVVDSAEETDIESTKETVPNA